MPLAVPTVVGPRMGRRRGEAPTGTNEIRVGGKVKGADPSGATVSIQRTSLVDENAQGATFVNDSPSNALTMHYGHTGVTAPTLVASPRTTTTDADGAWAFAGISSPGFYLIIISKPGYATTRYVVSAPEDGSPIVLDSDLVAGDGTLGGGVTGPDGAGLGGVDLTITDGTVTLKTITPTTGDIGKWSVTGLTTPGTYLVSASRRGFGTETKLVDLPAGGSVTDANIAMKAGVGSGVGARHVAQLSRGPRRRRDRHDHRRQDRALRDDAHGRRSRVLHAPTAPPPPTGRLLHA